MHTYVSNMIIKLKLGDFAHLQTTGKLIGIHKPAPKEATTHLIAPTGEQVKQYYIPESLVGQNVTADQMLTAADCDKAVIIKDQATGVKNITLIPKEVAEKIQDSDLPKNIMNVTVHTKHDADAVMFPLKDGQSYVFYPDTKDPDNIQNYNLLAAVLDKSDLAFCSIVNLQNHEGLFRLELWRGRIVLVKQGYPEQINPHEFPSDDEFAVAPIPEKVVEKAVKGFSKMVEPIDPETYRNRVIEEKVALKTAVDSGFVIEKAPKVQGPSSLDSLLDLFGED